MTTIVARWDPIPKEYFDDDLLGYSIELTADPNYRISENNGVEKANATFTNLEDWRHYTVTVRGYTRFVGGLTSNFVFYTCK